MRIVDRTQIIFESLINHCDYVTSSYLAEKTGVTSRTIREDIKLLAQELAEHHINLLSTPSKGYYIPEEQKSKAAAYFDFRYAEKDGTPILPAERIQAIIHQLLFGANAASIDALMDELCISSHSTLEKDMQDVEKWLAIHKLKLVKNRDGGLMVQGIEITIRYAMINYFWSFEDVKEATILTALQQLIQNKDILLIRDALHSLPKFQSNPISDAEYLNLMMYISFSLWRNENHHPLELSDGEKTTSVEIGIKSLTDVLIKRIEEKARFLIPESEKEGLKKFLSQSTLLDEDPSLDFAKNSTEFVDLIQHILIQLRMSYSIDFSRDEILIRSLIQYIHSLVQHTPHKAYIRNPSLDEIRKEYPSALEMAVTISDHIQEVYKILPDEDEIGFIALYLCAALERAKTASDLPPQKVVIICATGIGGSQLLSVKIQRYFRNLEIMGVYPAFLLHQAIQKAPDFIISTIPLENCTIPIIHIGHVLNENDLSAIRQYLDEKRSYPLKRGDEIFYDLFPTRALLHEYPCIG